MIRREDIQEPVVGGFVVFAVFLAIILSYGGKKVDGEVAGGYPVLASFGKIDGLGENASVMMGGIQIGSVIRQTLGDNYRAQLTLMIDEGIELPLDTSAAIHTDGVFGGKFIALEPGGEMDMIEAGGVIDFTQDSVVVEDLLELIIAQGKARLAKTKEKQE